MSDGNGSGNTGQQRQGVTPGRVLGARSASPAKRSAADMEGGDKSHAGGHNLPGSFAKEEEDEQSQFDTVFNGLNGGGEAMNTQETVSNGVDTSAMSIEADELPPYSENEIQKASNGSKDVPSIDEQVKTVTELAAPNPDVGQRGYIVSCKWLARVRARSSEGLNNPNYPKDAREGEIGQIDNSDIILEGALTDPVLKDMQKQSFIPLKPGLVCHEDYEILPYDAWGKIVGWYGNILKQKPVLRYAHDTAPPEAAVPNIMFEIYPPVITVRKVPQPNQDAEQLPAQSTFTPRELRLKDEQKDRGQLSPDDAIQLVSSRSERFVHFLKRSKEAVGIPQSNKVKIWKLLDPSKIAIDTPDTRQNGMLSPPESRSVSPKAARAPESKLLLDTATFDKMEVGKDLEHIDAKDETNNPSYNGKANMELYQLFEDTTIALEEMIGGPGGGEFASDSKILSTRLGIKKVVGSKPASATASGRTSPAPGSGMMTRGRQRRDGRTRGTVGLTNLGNTCYMNSALQCIRSVEELAIFFLSGTFKQQINANNPLGHGGVMAKKYAEVLDAIYTDNSTGSVSPTAFKRTLGSISPMFSGYGQQDSQEFLSFLVDALHEDLNRIQKKPYNENPDSDDNTVHDPEAIIKLGETYRANHKARNDSVAMDLFSGFYKNTMECPKCDKISITFDPYSLLTVQLPIESTFQHAVTFVPLRGKPVNHRIDMDKNATVKILKENVASKHKNVKADRLWMAEIYNHKTYKVFEDSTTLSEASIAANDYLFLFELEAIPSNSPSPSEKKYSYSTFSLSSREPKVPEMDDAKAEQFAVSVVSRRPNRTGYGWDTVLHPMYILLTRDQAQDFDTILKKILIAVSRLTSRPILTEFDAACDDDSSKRDEKMDDSPVEESAQVSDRSVPSEDGYVEISVDKSEQTADAEHDSADRSNETDDRPVPKDFMDSQYPISDELRTQLFAVNFAPSESGDMHLTGMTGFRDTAVRPMFERVKPLSRRQSMQSSNSDNESTTTTGSDMLVNHETDESENEDMDKPDLVLGGESESSLNIPPLIPGGSDDEDEGLPDDPLDSSFSRGGRQKSKKKRGKKGNLMTYSRKGKPAGRQNRPNSAGSLNSFKPLRRPTPDKIDQYYIKLGEGIVLDWYPEAFENLFCGNSKDDEGKNGNFVSHSEGKDLPFIADPEVTARQSRRDARKKHGITLDDCFVETGKREVLSEDNAWYCNRCKELRQAMKTLEIWTIPDILVVHLKRFGGNRSFRDKIDVLVDYPIEGLDMTDRVGLKEDGKEYIYDLFAVDNHYGGLGGGHYTAMAKNFYDGQWYDYNDSSCSKTGESRLHSAAAYLLFYRRRSDKPLGPQYPQDLVLEARNPQPTEPATEDTAEESDSGEGRLGGPNGSLHGSSSASTGAGVDRANPRGGGGGVGVGAAANSNPTTRTSQAESGSIGMLHGQPVYGPARPAHLEYGNQGVSEWTFDALNHPPDTDEPSETLLNNVDDSMRDDEDGDDDAASMTAMLDNTEGGYSFADDRMDEDFAEDRNPSNWSIAGITTPIESDSEWSEYHDDHQMYSSAHDPDADLDALHAEDTEMLGVAPADDGGVSTVVDVYPEPHYSVTFHDKMD